MTASPTGGSPPWERLGGAGSELEEVRRRRHELAAPEATLVVSIDVQRARVDRLLDERLRVSGA